MNIRMRLLHCAVSLLTLWPQPAHGIIGRPRERRVERIEPKKVETRDTSKRERTVERDPSKTPEGPKQREIIKSAEREGRPRETDVKQDSGRRREGGKDRETGKGREEIAKNDGRSREEVLRENYEKGKRFEGETNRELANQGEKASREVYLEYRGEDGKMERTRADFLFQSREDPNSWVMVEAKSSREAELTPNQRVMHERVRNGELVTVRSRNMEASGLDYGKPIRIGEIRESRPGETGKPEVQTTWKAESRGKP